MQLFCDGEPTPEFVRWTIGRPCPLRAEYDWTDPEQTERLLRPVRAVGAARSEGRVFEGVAFAERPPLPGPLDEARGFIIEEALALFGGEPEVDALCGACPANVAEQAIPHLAGCYGMFHVADAAALHQTMRQAEATVNRHPELQSAFPQTQPRWYGLWLEPQLDDAQKQWLALVLPLVFESAPHAAPGLEAFLGAVHASRRAGLPLFARLIPSGRLHDGAWKIDSHCKRCKAPRPLRDPACRVCGQTDDVCAGRTRKVRGERPFHCLTRQFGAERLQALVAGYNTSTEIRRSTC